MSIQIDRPTHDEHANVVLTTGDGYICAQGTINHAFEKEERKLVAVTVHAKILAPNDPLPGNPPPGTVSADFSSNNWFFPRIFGAKCGTGTGLPRQKLVVWAVTGMVTLSSDNSPFFGVCASAVDCGMGSGSGHIGLSAGYGGGMAAQVSRLMTAPARWALESSDFPDAEGTPFNGRWLLNLRQDLDGHCTWDNSPRGDTIPLVELRWAGPLLAVWQLLLRLGPLVVRYTRAVDSWNMLGPNTFTPADACEANLALPRVLTLVPG